jgi:cyclophilin family peptidyl-prolyl cis-trans isomerase
VFGQVIGGMDAVDKIKKGDSESGKVDDPDKIIKMVMASDSTDATAKADAEKLLKQYKGRG